MAKKEQATTRVALYEDYRKQIVRDFEHSQKESPAPVVKPKIVEKVVETPKITKAEALINEYEKSNKSAPTEKKHPPIALIVLTIVILVAIIAGVVYLLKRYYE